MDSIKLEVQRLVRDKVGAEAYLQFEFKYPKAYKAWMKVVGVLLGGVMDENEIILLRREVSTELKRILR